MTQQIKLVCVDNCNGGVPHLTVGKTYSGLLKTYLGKIEGYVVVDDNGDEEWYSSARFKTYEAPEPAKPKPVPGFIELLCVDNTDSAGGLTIGKTYTGKPKNIGYTLLLDDHGTQGGWYYARRFEEVKPQEPGTVKLMCIKAGLQAGRLTFGKMYIGVPKSQRGHQGFIVANDKGDNIWYMASRFHRADDKKEHEKVELVCIDNELVSPSVTTLTVGKEYKGRPWPHSVSGVAGFFVVDDKGRHRWFYARRFKKKEPELKKKEPAKPEWFEPAKVKVICVSNADSILALTVGKEYEVALDPNDESYLVTNDRGETVYYHRSRFIHKCNDQKEMTKYVVEGYITRTFDNFSDAEEYFCQHTREYPNCACRVKKTTTVMAFHVEAGQ